ncbi:MAG TPA: PPK2 family polyphosphate kinase [Flavobacterium sp.]|jgi:PPK2 family polyphosphate:nucleotide phosphotransferase
MSEINGEDFKVSSPFLLSEHETRPDVIATEEEIEFTLGLIRKQLSKIQDTMYAHGRYSMLICLQGMDTSGKDSMIRKVFKGMNPRGIVVHSFKQPNTGELEHDYLWRHYIALPSKGKITVFNRSHYENVLVTRVHPEIVLKENLPGIEDVENIPASFWEDRMQQICNFEKHLAQNGTIVLKIFLHLGKEEQRQRLLRRLNEEKHNWKFSTGDLHEREHWEEYMQYYEEAINRTSKPHAPWYVIPADDKGTARLIAAQIILNTLEKYTDIREPELDDSVKENLSEYRHLLEEEYKKVPE